MALGWLELSTCALVLLILESNERASRERAERGTEAAWSTTPLFAAFQYNAVERMGRIGGFGVRQEWGTTGR
eukprot:scaffold244715_cov41-Tisochrysis_lutea.AAC.2